jgi:RNA-dependent RNA polymerase
MALDNRGVSKDAFIELQEKAKGDIYFARDSLDKLKKLLEKHTLGSKFCLPFILEHLSKLGLDLKDNGKKKAIRSAFFERLLRYAMNHSLREVKFKARIPIPESYQLVGVADEGQAYIKEGVKEEDVFVLKQGLIYGISFRRLLVVLPYP